MKLMPDVKKIIDDVSAILPKAKREVIIFNKDNMIKKIPIPPKNFSGEKIKKIFKIKKIKLNGSLIIFILDIPTLLSY